MKDSLSLRLEFYNSFVAVCEERSFSKAASKTMLSQGAISQHIAALEKTYGARLLERGGEEVRVTPAGESVLRRAYEILAAERRLREELAKITSTTTNIILIAASTIPGEHLLPVILKSFRSTHPDVNFKVTIRDSEEAWKLLDSRGADFAAVGTLENHLEGHDLIELTSEELVLIAPPNSNIATKSKVSVKEVLKQPFVSRESGSGTRREVENMFNKAGYHWSDLNVASVLGSTEAVINAVQQGMGVSIISSIAAAKAAKSKTVKVVGLSDLEASRKLFMVRRKLETAKKLEARDIFEEFWTFVSLRVPVHIL
jgi:DNA-binding transcriptional LysR family regulator